MTRTTPPITADAFRPVPNCSCWLCNRSARRYYGLKGHLAARGMVEYTHRHLIKHRTDHLGGWYA